MYLLRGQTSDLLSHCLYTTEIDEFHVASKVGIFKVRWLSKCLACWVCMQSFPTRLLSWHFDSASSHFCRAYSKQRPTDHCSVDSRSNKLQFKPTGANNNFFPQHISACACASRNIWGSILPHVWWQLCLFTCQLNWSGTFCTHRSKLRNGLFVGHLK